MDIGDWLTPTLTVGTFDGTTTAALVITKPDNTTIAGTGEASSDGGNNWTADAFQLTTAGLWVMTWTVAGTGKGVQHSTVLVDPSPTGRAVATDSLATISDLIALVGTDVLTDAQIARAPALLAQASALIRRYTGQTFTAVANDVVVLRATGTEVRLPQRPVTAVASVKAVGWAGLADITLPVGTWGWDGLDIINIQPFDQGWWVNLPDVVLEGGYADTYRVTYSHGETTAPADVVGVCCGMTLRVLTSPSMVEGLTSEHIGAYSYLTGQGPGAGTAGAVVRLTETDKEALALYRRKATTIQLRL